MRILFATPGYKPAYRIGGPALSVSAQAEHLVQRGHEVVVFTTNSNQDCDLDVPQDQPVNVDGVEVWYFRRNDSLQRHIPSLGYFSKSLGWLYCPAMAAELDRLVPTIDVVHCHLPFVYPTLAAARAARRHSKPLFYHQRGVFDPQRLKFRGLKKRLYLSCIERPILRAATTLIALTEAEVESYRALGVSTHCRIVPNGIDVSRYRQRPSAGSRWVFPLDAKVILFLGRLHPIKGADTLLEGFLKAYAALPNCYLVMAGPDEWSLEAHFQKRVEQAGAGRRVLFPGMVTGDDKLDLLARADLFCLLSEAEGFSMAVLEAMASRTALLLSPGCHFALAQNRGAAHVAAAEAGAVSAALPQLVTHPDQLQSMARAGFELVQQDYTWDRITDQLLEAYEEGIQRSRKRTDESSAATILRQAAA